MIKKYDIVLCPDLKKKWVHFNVEIHEAGGKKTWRNRIGIHYSSVNSGFSDYPAFRPDVEIDLEETFNLKLNIESIVNRCFYRQEDRQDLMNNLESISIRNPIYYCLKSKLVWQNKEDSENPEFSENLIEIKEYKKGSDVYVVECQLDSKLNYDDGGSIEINRKKIKHIKDIYESLLLGDIKTKDFRDYCYYQMVSLIREEI
jgi:hypothetical protein